MGLQIIYHKHGVIQNAFQMHSWMGPLHTNSEENLMKDEAAMSWSGNSDSAFFHCNSYKLGKPHIN